jgi:hypothetical protein
VDEQVLTQLAVFDGLSRRMRKRITKMADQVQVPAGTALVHEGQLAWSSSSSSTAPRRWCATARSSTWSGAGTSFGEIGAIDHGGLRNAPVRATSPMQVLVLGAPDVRRLLDEAPDLGLRLRVAARKRRRPVAGRAES